MSKEKTEEFITAIRPAWQPYLSGTSGSSWLTESVRECCNAARRVGGRTFHLGPKVSQNSYITCLKGMSDEYLARLWGSCKYVSGLRRTEGFELPAIEDLVCGTRPVLFDREHYRGWYGDFAEYIPEGSRAEVTDSLEKLFRGRYRTVTRAERDEAIKRFDWRPIINRFWRRVLDNT